MTTDPNGITPPVFPSLPDPTIPPVQPATEYNGTIITGSWGCWWVVFKNITTRQTDIGNVNEIQVDMQITRMDCTSVTTNINNQAAWVQHAEGILPYGNDLAKLIEDDVIPAIGSPFHEMLNGMPKCGKLWETEARLRDYTITSGPIGTVAVSLSFTTMYQLPPIECPFSANDITLDLPVSVEGSSSFRQTNILRRFDWANPAEKPPATSDWTGVDMGGGPVNPSGVGANNPGIPADVPQFRFRIRTVQDTTTTVEGITDTMTQFQGIIGKRNSTDFLGFTQGQIWCDSVAFQPMEHNFYEVVIDFVYDHYYEHSQIPKFSPDGEIDLNEDGEADTVIWVRPQREEIDFNEIWQDNPQKWELIQEGWWKLYNADPANRGMLAGICDGGGGGVGPPNGEA